MVLGFLKSSTPPIAVDFGYSDLKLLQIQGGDEPALIAAARAEVPEERRSNPMARFAFLSEVLPSLLRKGNFRGKLVVSTIPAWQTFMQHMRVKKSTNSDEIIAQIRHQLQRYVLGDPENIVVRYVEVGDVFDGSQPMSEVICFAAGRDIVMRQVQAFKKCRLDIGGFHAEPVAIVKAFDHIHRRLGDDKITTMYVDLGTACTKVMIAHGSELRFTKSVPFGGRWADQRIAEFCKCEVYTARSRRLAEISHPTQTVSASAGRALGAGIASAGAVGATRGSVGSAGSAGRDSLTAATDERRRGALPDDLREFDVEAPGRDGGDEVEEESNPVRTALRSAVGQLIEELKSCVRYHHRIFPERRIDRLIFTGGESRDSEMCREIAETIGVVTFHGEPFKKLRGSERARVVDPFDGPGTFGWTVAMGLTRCPIGEE